MNTFLFENMINFDVYDNTFLVIYSDNNIIDVYEI